ncbi:MAG TPA: toast rack family protein [Anaerolineales bacterium]|nr:toast rack family protein [Anaerolineales bacterium]
MKTNHLLITLLLVAALSLAGCSSRARVGALRTESRSVELGDAKSVRVEINMGAGDLQVTGGAEKLMEAGFTYNVAALRPVVKYADGTLVVQQPETEGMPVLRNITDFRNEWDLRLYDAVPMDLSVNLGAGSSNLKLAGLPLTGLDVSLGAGEDNIDLSGDWVRDLHVTINTGAANIILRLPRDVGVRVKVEPGPNRIEATGLTEDGDVYTNDAYGVSEVTMQIDMEAGIGQINLEVEEAASATN